MVADAFVLRDDLPNADILDAIRGMASTDYQNRIPAATKGNIQLTIETLMDPANRQWKNEFIDALVNRIGMTIARSNSWTNPLGIFKRGMLTVGNTIEEIQVGLLKAHNWDPDQDYMEKTLFGRETPEVQANFHTINRQNFYKVTVNETLLNRAFLNDGGLAGFIAQLMEAPTTSDNLDEFKLTTSLFREYEANGGFFHLQVPDVEDFDSTAEDARLTLRKLRAMAGNLKFLDTRFNAAHMPVSASPDELLIFCTPEFNAAMDVEALSAAFNISKAEAYGRIIEIPKQEFGIANAQAIMTTEEFFVIADTLFQTTSQWNPANLSNNYFLHHHQIISCSRFAPAILFTTEETEVIELVYVPPTSVSAITILPDGDGNVPTEIFHGGVMALAASVVPADADQGLKWSVSGGGTGTYITQSGVLHLGAFDPLTAADTVTVTAQTTSRDPDDTFAGPQLATLVVDIGDGPLNVWPSSGSIVGITVAGVAVPAFVAGTHTYALDVPADSLPIEPTDVYLTSNGPVSAAVSVAGGDTVTIDTRVAPDAAVVTYTINVTGV